MGAATAALAYARSGLVDLRRQTRSAGLAFAAGLAGALLVLGARPSTSQVTLSGVVRWMVSIATLSML